MGGLMRPLTFGDRQTPTSQRSLRMPKGEPTQDRWIVGAFGDTEFSLTCQEWVNGKLIPLGASWESAPYSQFWDALSTLDCGPVKFWLIGWRVRYALERANFSRALSEGAISLPTIRAGKNRGKAGGRLSYSGRILEVDLVAGKNAIKVLDWSNFGVAPDGYPQTDGATTIETACGVLQDYLSATAAAGVRVSRSTAAQVGWSHARQSGLGADLACNLDGEARELERRACHGGRCEAFRLGEIPGTTYSLDVRSCYATICRDESLPCRLVEEYRHGLPVEAIDVAGDDHWIADVVISTDEPDYPLSWDGTPIYPIGQFRTALPWPELRHALMRGRVQRVLRAARYAAGPVLRPYAEWYLHARRAEKSLSVGGSTSWLKAMFNASLGYTARQKWQWIPWDAPVEQDWWFGASQSPVDSQTRVSAQVIDGEARWLSVAGEPRESMPFLHATICSYARVKLLEIFKLAGMENILYCDTDGILVTMRGAMRLIFEDEDRTKYLRGLVERFPCGSARIQGQKVYSVGDNVIAAGTVKTKRSALERRNVLTVATGRADSEGRVHPFVMTCEDNGGVGERWTNEMA
jgi:hypothetical protein